MGILNRLLQLGLDLAGLRLLYPSAELVNMTPSKGQCRVGGNCNLVALNLYVLGYNYILLIKHTNAVSQTLTHTLGLYWIYS